MPDRRRQGRVKLAGVMTAEPGEGAFSRLVDRLVEDRAAVGGSLVFVFVAGMIASNALMFQEAHHPYPLFATRDAPMAEPVVASAPLPPSDAVASEIATLSSGRGETVGSIPPEQVPLPMPAPAGPDIGTLLEADSALVSKLQRLLAKAGLYTGAIDGIYGSRTRAAIQASERSLGLPVTGLPNEDLLARLNAAPAPAVAAQPMPPVAALSHPVPPREVVAPSPRLQNVQVALNAIGYGPVTTDGLLGGATSDAIRRFELDNGMALTGTVSDDVVGRLVSIGAMPDIR